MSPIDFATLIIAARNERGLSQSQAAKEWKIPLRTLQDWEQVRSRPSAKHIEKLLPLLTSGSRTKRKK